MKVMSKVSFYKELVYQENRVTTKVILDTPFVKEIRILMEKGQVMAEHKAPKPIVVQVLEGEIEFHVLGVTYLLDKGELISVESNILHELRGIKKSVIRLTLIK